MRFLFLLTLMSIASREFCLLFLFAAVISCLAAIVFVVAQVSAVSGFVVVIGVHHSARILNKLFFLPVYIALGVPIFF